MRVLFPPRPSDYHNAKRKFVRWQEDQKGIFYQGEVDANGRRDGAGITLQSHILEMAHYKKGDKHGAYLGVGTTNCLPYF